MNWALIAKILKAIAELIDELFPLEAKADDPKQDKVRVMLDELIRTIEE